jgi:hypothetical protein
MEKQLTPKRQSERPSRASLSQRNRLSIKDRDPNYHYRLVNANLQSDPDRVERMQEIGYEVVPGKKVGQTGDSQVDNPSPVGSAGQISVGKGDKAVWMRIRKDWYQEDQAEKQAEIDEVEQQQKNRADYGSLKIEAKRSPV